MVKWKPIKEIFDFEKGTLKSTKCTAGRYFFVTAAEDWKTHKNYTHDCEALVFAMAASGSLGRTHYINDKFIASDLCFILVPKKGLKIDLMFYYRLFNSLRLNIVKKTATGTSKLAINRTNFGLYKIPYFDYDHQVLFSGKIEKMNEISSNFESAFDQQLSFLKKLRQSILQEAIEGKLTADWRNKNPDLISGENHASKLLETIKLKKDKLIKEGKIKNPKPLKPITDDEKLFVLPEGWVWCKLGDIACGFDYGSSLKSKKSGKVPVLRMGNIKNGNIDWSNLVYTDNCDEINKYMLKEKDLLFNRTNSRELVGKTALYEGRQKAIHAGYLVRFYMLGGISSLYVNYVMNSFLHRKWCNKVKTDAIGQSNINATKLRSFKFPLPSFLEQKIIDDRVKKLMSMIDDLKKQVTERKEQSEMLMKSVLKEAFEGKTSVSHEKAGAL